MSEQSPEKLNSSEAPAETYSLASILAEYKSEAFIRNERRYSREELEKRADEIIREMKRSVEEELAGESSEAEQDESNEAAVTSEEPSAASAEAAPETPAESAVEPTSEPEADSAAESEVEPEETEPDAAPKTEVKAEPLPVPEPAPEPVSASAEQPEPETRPGQAGEKTKSAAAETAADVSGTEADAGSVSPERVYEAASFTEDAEPPDEMAGPDPAELKRQKREARAEQARRRRQQRAEKAQRRKEAQEEARRSNPELTPEEAQKQYASGIASLRNRLFPACVLCALMVLLLLMNGGKAGPEVLRQGRTPLILLAALQLAVMLVGLDVLAKGVSDLIAAKPGCETLVLLANVAAEIDAVLMISGRGEGNGLPYCVTAAVSLSFAIWGTCCRRTAFRDTIRAMRLASVPTVVTAEDKLAEEGSVLNKRLASTKGFLAKCVEPDISERLYRKVMPACLLLIIILAMAAGYLSGSGAVFHCLAALSSAAAALTATLVFARPFSLIAKKLTGNGAALAGWRGAEDMAKAVGIIIRDLDVYPENSIILNGMKVLSGAHVEKVVAYTGSVILATGSGLHRVFGELMRQYAAPLYRVEDFDCGTEGGVCAFIGQEQVLVGTGAYMNLMGIRVPGSVDVTGAVYTAIDHELCGVFIVNYLPQELVQNALYRLENGRLQPIFAIRDFNINPAMMIQKFRLNEGSVTFLPPEDRYRLSLEPDEEKEPTALLSREGLWHYSETARGGRRLWRTTRRALLMTVLGAVLGVIIVFISCARGAFGAITPLKLLLAMLLWAFATLMIADSAEGD